MIPKRLREALGLKPGDPLLVALQGEKIILRKLTLDDIIEESKENYRQGKTLSHKETFEGLL